MRYSSKKLTPKDTMAESLKKMYLQRKSKNICLKQSMTLYISDFCVLLNVLRT